MRLSSPACLHRTLTSTSSVAPNSNPATASINIIQMSSMVDSYRPQPQHYDAHHRKPIPAPGAATRTQTLTSQQQHSLHNRSRTSSSSVFPQVTTTTSSTFTYNQPPVPQPQLIHPPALPPLNSRRTLSNATASSASTNMSLAQTNPSLHRTPSNRSGNSPTSYVSLMRKQKATVWCDRAQHEDPRLMEQRRQAKMRAVAEVVGGNHPRSSTSTASINSSVRSKIRHHGVPKATRYAPANLSGTGVPMRLSATEVDEGDSDDDSNYQATPYHQRTNSGRSSLGSGPRVSYAPHGGRFSTASTPPSGQGISPPEDKPEDETPVPGGHKTDYFATPTGLSTGSGSSGEREFGGLGQMPDSTPRNVEESKKTTEELRRRGSVDDRSMTMSGGVRLFVANPDLSD